MALTLADALRQTGYQQDGQLQAPAPTQPNLSTMAGNYFAQLPEKTAQNAINMNNMVQNAMPYNFDPRSNGVNPNYDPQASKDFANYIPNLMGATAWHGTPHKIQGQFDINKIGSGEGNQVYGHGMYFAENPKVAESYKTLDPVGGPTPSVRRTLNGQELEIGTPEYHAGTILSRNGMTIAQAKKDVQKWIAEGSQDPRQAKLVEGWTKTLETLQNNPKKSKFGELPHEGNLYKVDIPDEHIPNMLDWDKPLSQQPKIVKEYFTKRGYTDKDWSAQSFFKNEGDPAEVSAILKEAGIPGVRYLDEGSRGKGVGTSNFVVFDPSTVKILEENSKPVTRKELIEQQLNKVLE
jgi:hypothetical protein